MFVFFVGVFSFVVCNKRGYTPTLTKSKKWEYIVFSILRVVTRNGRLDIYNYYVSKTLKTVYDSFYQISIALFCESWFFSWLLFFHLCHFTVTTSKSLYNDELQHDSPIVMSVGINSTTEPRNRESDIKPSVVLSNTKVDDLPKGKTQQFFSLYTYLNLGAWEHTPWILQNGYVKRISRKVGIKI